MDIKIIPTSVDDCALLTQMAKKAKALEYFNFPCRLRSKKQQQ